MSEYWNRRSAQLESLTQKRTDETVKFVNGIYSEALKSIGERVKTVFDRYSSGGSLGEESALKLLNMKQTAEFRQELLNKYNSAESAEEKKRLAAVLDAPAYADRISRLEALANEIYAEALSLGTTEQVQLEKRLIAEYKHTYYRTTFDIQQYTGEFYDFEKLSSGRVKEAIRHKWLGKNYSERVWDNTDKTAGKLRSVIIKGIMTGQSSRTMTDSLAAVLGEDSDSGARFKFSRLIRTEVNYISGQATQRAYEQADIEEYVFLATLDKRTCHDCGDGTGKSCAELDGKRFKLSEAEVGVNKHPMHPFCRCSDYPYIEGKKGTRAARDESGKTIFVPDGMTYDEWYRKYVDKSKENGIIDLKSEKMSISSIEKPIELPIEQRNTGKGNPNAILLFNVELNNRQKKLLEFLPDYDSKVTVRKSGVNMKDLSALTAVTGDEFAMFTKGKERLIIRGNAYRVNIDVEAANKLAKAGYKWSGHTHPGTSGFCLEISDGDNAVWGCFKQGSVAIYNSKGDYNIYMK